jgi:membrane-associated protein
VDLLLQLVDIALHLDKHLAELLVQYGGLVFIFLFLIVFCETGLVVTPFLPGDSLLFLAGALAATNSDSFDIVTLMIVLTLAAILGDGVNFRIGRWVGPRVFRWENSRFFSRSAFDKAHAFYEQYGGVTIVAARFMPFIRTYVPFVAGVAAMTPARFTFFNVSGGILWVVSLCLAGYWFGNLPWVRANLSLLMLGIIGLSVLPLIPVAWHGWRQRASVRSA